MLCLGDYLYEYAPGEYGHGPDNEDVRPHDPPREMVGLADYRRRHAQYKRDRDLQDLHARYAWIVTWDDHEVTNDQWRRGAENHQPGTEGDYLRRRARAHRAYDEWLPVRMSGTADLRDGTRLFRRLRFGRLAELSMLDLRTYRSEQVAQPAPPVPQPDGEVSDPARTITGDQQLAWLQATRCGSARPQWRIVGNPVMIAPVDFGALPDELVDPVNDVTGLLPEDGAPYNLDQWDGYTADRHRVFDHIRDRGISDVLFVTGDIHSGWACELPYDAVDVHRSEPRRALAPVSSSCAARSPPTTSRTSPATRPGRRAPRSRRRSRPTTGTSSTSTSTTTASRSSTSPPTGRRWTGSSISSRTDRDATVRWETSWRTRAGTGKIERVDRPVGGAS